MIRKENSTHEPIDAEVHLRPVRFLPNRKVMWHAQWLHEIQKETVANAPPAQALGGRAAGGGPGQFENSRSKGTKLFGP